MRINYEDRSYVDFLQRENGNVTIVLGSMTHVDGKKTLSVSAAEVTLEQLQILLSDIKSSSKVVEREDRIDI